jgi:CheY-like chemotaxis protein
LARHDLTAPNPPAALVRDIELGECVAFVGAGFSAAAVPAWQQLLEELAAGVSETTRDKLRLFLTHAAASGPDYEAAAQVLRDEMGEQTFIRALRERLARPRVNDMVRRRLDWLRSIPFRAILTTNFDGLLEGVVPGRDAYLGVLRPHEHRWWDRRYWDQARPGPQVVKLHGDLLADPPAAIVLGRRDYRRRLHGDAAYQTFLRAVFATSTVLYLGFSFTDAYLNELRSEILALLDYRGGDAPIAYALINDVPPQEVEFLRDHEGIEVLTYDTQGGKDYSGFDRWLEALHEAASPVRRLGRLLARRRVLWLDPQPEENDDGLEFLREAAGGDGAVIDAVSTWNEAIDRLSRARYDLVITRWGHAKAEGGGAVGERLLQEIRRRDLRAPAIVFSSREHAAQNKRTAFALGARACVSGWSALFQEIEGVLG